ncbi:unnamed protein product [Closterium sp. NIES-54]
MLAWALVEGENKDSWRWFLQNFLKSFPEWPHRDGASIISDRDKGLIPAARDVLPLGIPHYFCAWHLHQNVVNFGEAAALFYWRLVKCRLDDKWDALVAAYRHDFAPMANDLLRIEKPISGPSPADASEQQRPAPTTAAEARQQAAGNHRQGREAARATMGHSTTSRAHGCGAGDASAAGASPAEPEPPTESTADPMAQAAESPATNSPPARPSGSTPATARPFDYARILRHVRSGYILSSIRTDLPRAIGSNGNSAEDGEEPNGGSTCQALVLVSLDHPWPDVGSANPGVNTAVDAEEDDEEDADAKETNAEEVDAEDVEASATAEGVQEEAGVDDDDNTPESGVADGDHTTCVRTGFRHNKRGTRKKLGINLIHWTRLKAPTRRFGIFTSNAAEQVNSFIVPIRRLPVTLLLWGLMDWYRNRYCERKMAALERTDLLTEALEERMVEKETRAEGYELLGGDHEEGTIQTRDTDDPKEWRSFNVNLAAKTCDYTNWDQYQFPCSHAVAFAMKRNPRTLVSDFYTTKNWAETYSSTVRGSCVDHIILEKRLPPPSVCDALPFRHTAAGRPPSYARIEKAVHPYKCSVCKMHGHNKNRCMGKYGGSAVLQKRGYHKRPKSRKPYREAAPGAGTI